MKKVLIINAHQKYEGISEGKLNNSLVNFMKDELKGKFEVKITIIEDGYNVDEEVEKHLLADIIITQTPCYWFGSPWIYKKYIDEVFTAGMIKQSFLTGDGRTRSDPSKQYGTGGKMQGKKYMLSVTFNAPKESFGDAKQKLFASKTFEDLFVSNTANYKFCGAEILPYFACYDVLKNPQIVNDFRRLKEHLAKVI